MANREHLEILKQGVEVWNAWRKQKMGSLEIYIEHLFDEDIAPDLSGVDLSRMSLSDADLSQVIFRDSNLSEVNLHAASLVGADLSGASLHGAQLDFADLALANLNDANLAGAFFFRTALHETVLTNSDFLNAQMAFTIISNVDLRRIRNLESVTHHAPSSIGIDTIHKSRGNIPEVFLRGCGVPESFIMQIRELMAALEPIQFYSCFISYSSTDEPFAERLYADLQNKGVRCWFAPEDLKIGAEIRKGIDESIRNHDKLLLVLSETSVKSQWVEQEVETAMAKEREQARTVLFPIRVDDTVMQINAGWPAYLKNARHIGDFTRWKEHDSYQNAFKRLLRDLRAEEKKL
jgi:hypothetical protein